MNEKVIRVLEKILAETDKIDGVNAAGNEIFFRYGDHIISLLRREASDQYGAYGLYFYPGWSGDIGRLIQLQERDPDGVKMVHYHDAQYPLPAHRKLFSKLYDVLVEKSSGVEDVLDHILDS